MYQVVVSYAHPEDPDAFVEHYAGTHAPLAHAIPGLTSFTWMVCETADGSRPPHFVIARLEFASKEDALAGLGGPEGQAAVADLANFAQAGVELDLGEIRG